jgi:hypothetical protein
MLSLVLALLSLVLELSPLVFTFTSILLFTPYAVSIVYLLRLRPVPIATGRPATTPPCLVVQCPLIERLETIK